MTIGIIDYYREYLRDVKVSNCPYCGSKRVVVHIHEPYLEQEDSYIVEHSDEREAIDKKCFTEYCGFNTPKEAVKAADTRTVLDILELTNTCYNLYDGDDVTKFNCSECGYDGQVSYKTEDSLVFKYRVPRYCPNCGSLIGKKDF